MFAMRLAGIASREAVPAPQVLAMRNGFEVRGTHAQPIPTEVVEFEARRDRTDHPLVEHAMCTPPSSRDLNVAVAVRNACTRPSPTGRGEVDVAEEPQVSPSKQRREIHGATHSMEEGKNV